MGEMMPTKQSAAEMAAEVLALRAQLTEKDREEMKLLREIAGPKWEGCDDVDFLEQFDPYAALAEKDREIERLKAEWVQEREERLTVACEHSNEMLALQNQLSASQAREREAVERAEKAEGLLKISRVNREDAESALAAKDAELQAALQRADLFVEACTKALNERDAAIHRAEANTLLRHAAHEVLEGIRQWGAQEDGIPEEVFPAYSSMKAALNQALTPEETAAILTKKDALAAARNSLAVKTAEAEGMLERLAEGMEKRPLGNGFDRHDWMDEFRAALNGGSGA